MNSNLDGAQPIAPEQGGDAADELAYRLRQQQLSARFGLFALKTRDIDALLQEAARTCAEGLHSEFCKVMEFLPTEDELRIMLRDRAKITVTLDPPGTAPRLQRAG